MFVLFDEFKNSYLIIYESQGNRLEVELGRANSDAEWLGAKVVDSGARRKFSGVCRD
jgi:hypothetical protein